MKKIAILAELLDEMGCSIKDLTVDDLISLMIKLKHNTETIIKNKK